MTAFRILRKSIEIDFKLAIERLEHNDSYLARDMCKAVYDAVEKFDYVTEGEGDVETASSERAALLIGLLKIGVRDLDEPKFGYLGCDYTDCKAEFEIVVKNIMNDDAEGASILRKGFSVRELAAVLGETAE